MKFMSSSTLSNLFLEVYKKAWIFWMLTFVSDISNFVNLLIRVTSFITEIIYFWENLSLQTGVIFFVLLYFVL